MLTGAVGLRMRDVPIIANLTMAVLLIFCGVNVPLDKLPHWMHVTAEGLPLTHAIAAARRVADGASLGSVSTSIAVEAALGFAYLVVGLDAPPRVRGTRPAARDVGTGMRTLRLIYSGFRMNLKVLGTSAWFLLMSVIQPIIFATIAYYMFRSGGRSGTLLYASLGAGMMGVWSWSSSARAG